MIVNPKQLKEFAEAVDGVEEDFQQLVDAEPEIKKYLDKARGWAKLRYERETAPLPSTHL